MFAGQWFGQRLLASLAPWLFEKQLASLVAASLPSNALTAYSVGSSHIVVVEWIKDLGLKTKRIMSERARPGTATI